MELVEVPDFLIGLEELEELGCEGNVVVLGWWVWIGSGIGAEVADEEEDWGFGFWGLGFKTVEEGF